MLLSLPAEAVAVQLGHQGLLTVSRAAVGVQGGAGTILMAPVMSRAGSSASGAHLQPTAYHLARGG